MEIVHLTPENIEEYAYPCMMKKTRWVKHPERYRAVSLAFLQKTLGTSVHGICAIRNGQSVGHLFYGLLKGAGFPVRCREENIPAIFCTHVRPSFGRQGAGKAMVEAAVGACQDAPGLLVLASGMKSYMPIEPFLRLGFHLIHEDGFWKIGYYPIQKASVHVETYTPELEWDYIKPFTFITGDFCPFLVHLREEQKKCASRFHEQLPIEEIPFKEAIRRDENAVPGFYLYGKEVPTTLMAGWRLKRYIKKGVRDESRKTFGTTAPTEFTKRK
jgi:predicted GNAT family acetyltransferase